MLGGLHDLSYGSAMDDADLCISCHPDTSGPDSNYLTYEDVTTDYTSSLDATATCLSCHDGSIATNTIVVDIETESEHNHPVFIEYNDNTYGLKPSNTLIYGWYNATTINDLLTDGQVKCTTCHNPHDNTWGTFLRKNNGYKSALCNSCHTF
jgi:predicted CXXCH cytochrome family protein